jgi:hypothetical protein
MSYDQDHEASTLYEASREDIARYALRLLCPLHGIKAVVAANPVGHVRGEVGTLSRIDYSFRMTCGCRRRKDLRIWFSEIERRAAQNSQQNGTA